MKLWLLEAIEGAKPWKPWYDKAFGFVVRAADENEARQLAASEAGDEKAEAWLNAATSTCCELTADGEPEVILCNYAAA